MTNTRRYALQRFGTWRWLDYEAPLVSKEGPEWVRDGFGIIRATIPSPAAHRLTADDGHPMFEAWSTLVHVEDDSYPEEYRRRWSGWVSEATLTRSGWDITILEFPGYFQGIPYEGLVRAVQKDPADVLRQLVADTQSWPGAWFGCSVKGKTPVRVGTSLDDQIAAARSVMDARRQQLDSYSKTQTSKNAELRDLDSTLSDEVAEASSLWAQSQEYVKTLVLDGAPPAEIATAKLTMNSRESTYKALLSAYNSEVAAGKAALAQATATKEAAQSLYDQAKESYDALRARRRTEEGAYEISGEDLKDTYKAIRDLAEECGFECTTETRYSEGAPQLFLRVHHPKAGGRRDDLVFSTDTNILSPLELEHSEFASYAIGVGAGEGSSAVRVRLSTPTHRVRRVVTAEDKSAKTNAAARARARAALRTASGGSFPREIEVRDHPNCPIGSWSVGDVIRIEGVTSVGSRWSGLARIRSWNSPNTNRARVKLDPA